VSISEGSRICNSIIQNTIIGCNSNIENIALKDSLVGNDVTLKGDRRVVNLGDSSEDEPG
jgi:hypothetical protein